MQRFLVPSILILLLAIPARAADPVHVFSQRYGGTNTDEVRAVAFDAAGNMFVAGKFTGTANFGGSNLVSAGGEDVFLAKYDATGAHLWSQRFGGSGGDYALAMAIDAAGNVHISGAFGGTVNFGGGNLVGTGFRHCFIAKYDASGSHLWSEGVLDGTSEGWSMVVDPTGDVTVGGQFSGTVNFGGGDLTHAGGDSDAFVAKFDAGGNHVWSQRFGGTDIDTIDSLEIDAALNIYVAGYFEGTCNYGGANLTSVGVSDIVLAKYNSAGTHLWSQRQGGALATEIIPRLALDGASNVYVTGWFDTETNLGGGNLTGAGSEDMFLASYDSNGSYRWSQVFGGPFSDAPHSIAATASGDVYVTGFFSSVANFGGSNLTSGGASDIFMAKYDASGSHQWSVRFGGTSFDQGRSIAADGSGNVLLGSDFRNTVNFGGSNLTIAGATDIALARFSDAAPNTQAGSNVQVSPIDATTSTTPVALTFSSVTTAGITSLTTGPSGPSTPGTFILGDGTYYNLSTTAGTTGDITVCITYNEAALTVPEGALRLLHWDTNLDPDAWVDLTTSLDTGTNVICGVTDHFSPFVIGAGSVTAVDNGMPAALALQQNVPNPFNPATVITYDVPQSGAHVTIRIYDTKGAAVRTLVHEQRPAGSHRVVWDGLNNSGVRVSSGVYFCRMTSGSFAQSRRMVLLK